MINATIESRTSRFTVIDQDTGDDPERRAKNATQKTPARAGCPPRRARRPTVRTTCLGGGGRRARLALLCGSLRSIRLRRIVCLDLFDLWPGSSIWTRVGGGAV